MAKTVWSVEDDAVILLYIEQSGATRDSELADLLSGDNELPGKSIHAIRRRVGLLRASGLTLDSTPVPSHEIKRQ